jgi:hypothetical protein
MANGLDALYKYTITWSYKAQTMQTVLWFRTKTQSPKSDAGEEVIAIMTEVSSWFTTNVLAFANNGLQCLQAVGQVMAGGLNYQAILNYVNTFGVIAGDGLPPHDAAVISLYTPFHSKRTHGRIFIPAISESDQEGGQLTQAATVRLNKIASDYLTRFGENGTSSYVWGCVFSRANGVQRNQGPPPHLVYDQLSAIPVTRTTVTSVIRTQRSRRIH